MHRCAADAELPSDLRWTDPSSAKFTLSAFTRAVGALPLYFPSTLALAMPTSMRSLISSRSSWAIAPSMLNMSLPVGVVVPQPLMASYSASSDCAVIHLAEVPITLIK